MSTRGWEVYDAAQVIRKNEERYREFIIAGIRYRRLPGAIPPDQPAHLIHGMSQDPKVSEGDLLKEAARSAWIQTILEKHQDQYYYWDRTITPLITTAATTYPLEETTVHRNLLVAPVGWFYSPDVPFCRTLVPFDARVDKWADAATQVHTYNNRQYVALPVYGLAWAVDADYLGIAWIVRNAEGSLGSSGFLRLPLETPVRVPQSTYDDLDLQVNFTEEATQLLRVFFAAQAWVQQSVVRVDSVTAPRAERRRAEHAGRPVPVPVRVVVLRRVTKKTAPDMDTDGELAQTPWTCQWVVSGHWRSQYYPSTGTHAPVWIRPYIKGPDDKPMKAPAARVFTVQR